MGTPLQKLYDRFISKVDEDLTDKEALIFALVDSAISKSYKTCVHKLSYVVTDEYEYTGYFDEELNNDEIELLALWMLYEWNRRSQQKLIATKTQVGTSDFNRLEGKKEQLQSVNSTMKITESDIEKLKNDFNTYKY